MGPRIGAGAQVQMRSPDKRLDGFTEAVERVERLYPFFLPRRVRVPTLDAAKCESKFPCIG